MFTEETIKKLSTQHDFTVEVIFLTDSFIFCFCESGDILYQFTLHRFDELNTKYEFNWFLKDIIGRVYNHFILNFGLPDSLFGDIWDHLIPEINKTIGVSLNVPKKDILNSGAPNFNRIYLIFPKFQDIPLLLGHLDPTLDFGANAKEISISFTIPPINNLLYYKDDFKMVFIKFKLNV